MRARAVLLAALLVAPAGCITFDEDRTVEVELLVTADVGTEVLDRDTVTVPANASVLDALREAHTVDTAYGGGFVEAIDGRASGYPDEKLDWFYHVDTRLADVGAAERSLAGDALVVWDHRPWNHSMTIPHVLTGLDAWPGGVDEPPVEQTPRAWEDNATAPGKAERLFARVDGDVLVLEDARGVAAERLEPPWLVVHAVAGPDPGPDMLVLASSPDATGLAERLAAHPPTGLGAAVTPNATHEVPAA